MLPTPTTAASLLGVERGPISIALIIFMRLFRRRLKKADLLSHGSQNPTPPHPRTLHNVYNWDLQPGLRGACVCVCVCDSRLLSCPTLSDPMDCSPPGSSVHGILQARILECSCFLLQGIFLTQGWNTGLLHCRQILYHFSYQGREELTFIQFKTVNMS